MGRQRYVKCLINVNAITLRPDVGGKERRVTGFISPFVSSTATDLFIFRCHFFNPPSTPNHTNFKQNFLWFWIFFSLLQFYYAYHSRCSADGSEKVEIFKLFNIFQPELNKYLPANGKARDGRDPLKLRKMIFFISLLVIVGWEGRLWSFKRFCIKFRLIKHWHHV